MHTRLPKHVGCTALFALIHLSLLCFHQAGAATVSCSVNNLADSGSGSLRSCIERASGAASDIRQIDISASGTLSLLSPITVNGFEGQKFVIQASNNGFVLDATALSDGGIFIFPDASTAPPTINDFTFNYVTIQNSLVSVITIAGGALTLSQVVVRNVAASAFNVTGATSVTIMNSTFDSNGRAEIREGSLSCAGCGAVTLLGSSFRNAILSGNRAGAVWVGFGSTSVSVVECVFDSNSGGGLYAEITGSAYIADSTFTNNTGFSVGSGISVISTSSDDTVGITMTNCIFRRNGGAFVTGGGSYLKGLVLSVAKCTFTDNFGTTGGGLYIDAGYPTEGVPLAVISDSIFHRNSGSRGGGGLVVFNIQTVLNCEFINNTCGPNGGGGIQSWGNYDTYRGCDGCTFIGNSATGGGGAFFGGLAGDTGYLRLIPGYELVSSTFINNTAGRGFGGAIYVSGKWIIADNRFFNNSAGSGGAVYYSNAGCRYCWLNLNFCRMSGNRAPIGAALYYSGYCMDFGQSVMDAVVVDNNIGPAIMQMQNQNNYCDKVPIPKLNPGLLILNLICYMNKDGCFGATRPGLYVEPGKTLYVSPWSPTLVKFSTIVGGNFGSVFAFNIDNSIIYDNEEAFSMRILTDDWAIWTPDNRTNNFWSQPPDALDPGPSNIINPDVVPVSQLVSSPDGPGSVVMPITPLVMWRGTDCTVWRGQDIRGVNRPITNCDWGAYQALLPQDSDLPSPSLPPSVSPSPSPPPIGQPSPDPSESNSASPSPSPSSSPSPSPSPSSSSSPSPSPSPPALEEPSPDPSESDSASPSPSSSPSAAPLEEPSPEPSESINPSPSHSPLPSSTPSTIVLTSTPSSTPSGTPSPSITASQTASVSPSSTPSVSPSGSPSQPPSTSPAPSASNPPSATATATPSSSSSVSPSSSASSTPPPSPGSSGSPSPSTSSSPTASSTSSTTPSHTPSVSPSPTAPPSGSAPPSPSTSPSTAASPTASGTSSTTPSRTSSATSSPTSIPSGSTLPSPSTSPSTGPSSTPAVTPSTTPSRMASASPSSTAIPSGSLFPLPSTSPSTSTTPTRTSSASPSPTAIPSGSLFPSPSRSTSTTPSRSASPIAIASGSVSPSPSRRPSTTPSHSTSRSPRALVGSGGSSSSSDGTGLAVGLGVAFGIVALLLIIALVIVASVFIWKKSKSRQELKRQEDQLMHVVNDLYDL